MARGQKRILIILAAAAVLALVGWRVYLIAKPASKTAEAAAAGAGPRAGGPAGQRGAAPVAVEIAQITRATLRDAVLLTGSLDSPSRVEIAAKVPGRLERVLVQVGEAVRQGQVLAQLEDEEYRQSLEQAKAEEAVAGANLEAAQIGVQAAQRELERVRSLQDKQIASQAELESRQTQLAQAQVQVSVAGSQLKQKQVAVEAAQLRLAQTRLVASWNPDGRLRVVGERLAEPGALLQTGSSVLSILELDPLEVRLRVTEVVYPRLRPGLAAAVSAAVFPGRKFAGTLSAVAPFLDRSTGQADAWVQIRNADGALKPGMAVQVELEFGRRVNAPVVPEAALVSRDGVQGVFEVQTQSSVVRFVPVRAGAAEGGLVEILEPALEGPVVVVGQHLLQDGSAVILPK
jgi:RND family efflux transporter MFP subunit